MKCVVFLALNLAILASKVSFLAADGSKNLLIANHGSVHIRDKESIKSFNFLSDETKKDVLKHLTPYELFEFIQCKEYEEYHSLAAEVYGKKHGHLAVATDISFDDVTTLTTFLRSFNKHIRNFKLVFGALESDALAVAMDALFDNCATNLTRLEMRYSRGTEFNVFSGKSFPSVEELSFISCTIQNQTLDLQQVFPNVRRFSALSTEYTSWFDKILESPHLTQLQVYVTPAYFSEDAVLKILNNNRNIRQLGLYNASPNLVRNISLCHANIDSLSLIYPSTDFNRSEEIFMQNVTEFSYEGTIDTRISISFANLKELQWRCKMKPDQLLEFIEKHENTIETLDLIETKINDHHLAKIQQLKQLKRISLRYRIKADDSFTTNGLIDLIKASENLLAIRLAGIQPDIRSEIIECFESRLMNDWVESLDVESDADHFYLVKQPKWQNSIEFFNTNTF